MKKKILSALTNTKIILAVLAQLGIIAGLLQLDIDWTLVTAMVTAVLNILVISGVLTNKGMDTTKWNQ